MIERFVEHALMLIGEQRFVDCDRVLSLAPVLRPIVVCLAWDTVNYNSII
jgi:hypothetical protein